MPEYLRPGVYIEEEPSGARSIAGVSTSVTAFIGPAGATPTPSATTTRTRPLRPPNSGWALNCIDSDIVGECIDALPAPAAATPHPKDVCLGPLGVAVPYLQLAAALHIVSLMWRWMAERMSLLV